MRIRKSIATFLSVSLAASPLSSNLACASTALAAERTAGGFGLFHFAKKHPKTSLAIAAVVMMSAHTLRARAKTQEAEAEQAESDGEVEDGSTSMVCASAVGEVLDDSVCNLNAHAPMEASVNGGVLLPYSDGAYGRWFKVKNSEILTANMETALDKNQNHVNEQKPDGCAAHHIVMAGAWEKNFFIQASQRFLKNCGIGINSFWNGVYLPNIKKGGDRGHLPAICKLAANHRFIHTKEYKEKVYNRLVKAYDLDYPNIPPGVLTPPPPKECFWVKGAMGIMKAQLQTDTF